MTSEFNCFIAEKLKVSFVCSYCNNRIVYIVNHIPNPDFEGDSFSSTVTDDYDSFECSNCHHQFDYTIQSSSCGGFFYIDELNDDNTRIDVEELGYQEYEEAVLNNTKYFITFSDQIENIEHLMKLPVTGAKLNTLLNNILFSNVITTLETYLSDALITTVMNNENILIKFVQTFKDFENKKIDFNKIFEIIPNIRDIVKKELLELLYHNLPKISGIYKNTLDIQFPSIKEVMKLINIRHDLIHRNGKNKDGDVIEISKEKLIDTISTIKKFISDIEDQIQLTPASS